MYEHYITIDAAQRIIDGFTTAQKKPTAEDIFLRRGGARFELYGKDPGRKLSMRVQEKNVWLYAWDGFAPRHRSKQELAADMPPADRPPTDRERIENLEADTQTLAAALLIAFGGE